MTPLHTWLSHTLLIQIIYRKTHSLANLGGKWEIVFHLSNSNVLSVMGNKIRSNLRGVERYQKDNQNTFYGHLHESFEEAKYLGLAIRQDLEWKKNVNNAPHEDQ